MRADICTPNRDSGQTWFGSQVKGHLGQGHEIFRVGAKLINSSVLKLEKPLVAHATGGLHACIDIRVSPSPAAMLEPISLMSAS